MHNRRYEREDERYGRGSNYGDYGGDYGRAQSQQSQRFGDTYEYGGGSGGGRRGFEDYERGRDYGERQFDREDFGGRRAYGYGGNTNQRFDRDYGREYERDYDRGDDRGYGGRDFGRGHRGQQTDYGRTTSRFYGGSGYGRDYDRERYGRDYDFDERYERGSAGRGREGRGWWERATDEVASWFGDDEAERRRRRDEMSGGNYRGRGPKNYRRSDSRIEEDINDRLSDHPFLDASDVEVEVENAEVKLSGTVGTRRDKRLAEDIAESVSGVENVENRIRVKREEWGAFNERDRDSATSIDTVKTAAAGAGRSGTTTGTRTSARSTT